MKNLPFYRLIKNSLCIVMVISMACSCGRGSSPEERMSLKLEALQKEMIDSLAHQNRAILDSLGRIREELNEIKQLRK
ncbi:MAG: hypothetical protein H7Y86_19910 [Rhizobacter sp.]|nr:hypothetical protein [Ferruginibacter sp.]